MLPASKIIFQVPLILRGGSVEGVLVSLIAVVNEDEVDVLGLQAADIDRTRNDVQVFLLHHLKPVFVGILDVVVVGNSGAAGASMMERIVAAGLFLNLIREIP